MSACVKCGSEEKRTVYHGQGCNRPGCGCAACLYGDKQKQHEEHLHHYCQNCRYDWITPTLDSLPAALSSPETDGNG